MTANPAEKMDNSTASPTSVITVPGMIPSVKAPPIGTAANILNPASTSPMKAVGTSNPTAVPVGPGAVSAVQPVSLKRPAPSGPQPTNLPAGKAPTKSKKKKTTPVVTMATASIAQSTSQGAQGENTGRWTAEEHRLFLQGLELHGKGWKKIASLIKSRTVVQIRTHAQKYFQKLAKARQNGEEGDVAMEGRGGLASVTSISPTGEAQNNKRRRQTCGTKRKVIQSVVASAQRQGKKMAAANGQLLNHPNDPQPPIPAVAPSLAHFLLPNAAPASSNGPNATSNSCVPSITTAQGTISGPALEDSLFRFLTPAPMESSEPLVNEVARQAGANPITLPSDNSSHVQSTLSGEVSPTGVADLSIYPSWADAKDTPSWYTKGSDVDVLLEVGDTLDWLADTGDFHEAYNHINMDSAPSIPDIDGDKRHEEMAPSTHDMNISVLPVGDSNYISVVPPLPSLFNGSQEMKKGDLASHSHMSKSISVNSMEEHLQVFDSPMEEHDFVSTILENTTENPESLPVL